ncbi:MAG: hypothetical protein PVJ14_09320 [Chromatiales bacterium]|jgi:hypothetical protein
MKQRLIVSLSAIMLLAGCSEPDSEQARYTRESLQLMDRDCIKGAVEAQMQQAADYSRSRIHGIRGDSAPSQESGTGSPDVTGALLGNCFESTAGDN